MKTFKIRSAIVAISFLFFTTASFAQAYGEIRGVITDKQSEPIPFATIKILQGNQLVGGTQSNEEGRYCYKPLNPGSYEMLVLEAGHQTQPVNKIKVVPNEATYVDVKLTANVLGEVVVTAKAIDYTKTGADKSMYSMVSLDAKELMENASYTRGDIKGALVALSSDVVESTDGEVHFRGSRGDANAFFVDGVRTLGSSSIPGLSIENLTVFSGGVPAMYGDVSSGVVIVTTQSYFSGIRDKNIRIAKSREKSEE
jgi:hypothetical protein